MTLTADHIRQVRESWGRVQPIQEQAAGLFYDRLFELDPSLRPLFKGDMASQGRKLMHIIGVAVASLDHLGDILETVREMGRRHAGYGVRDEHYATVGQACSGPWSKAWARVSRRMSGMPGPGSTLCSPTPCARAWSDLTPWRWWTGPRPEQRAICHGPVLC